MARSLVASLFVLLVSSGPPLFAEARADATRERALAELRGPHGPVRFAVVRDGLYRGGQPTPHHLELLHALGVNTVIDLRRGNSDAEAAAAQRLGIRLVRFPFFGIFGADHLFLANVVEAIRHGGSVYVHCHVGRDRTSLVIALYRVLVEGWEPRLAWQKEAIAYGYVRSWWYGKIEDSYLAAVKALAGK
jgi:protein tyrosine/serine phosphatase